MFKKKCSLKILHRGYSSFNRMNKMSMAQLYLCTDYFSERKGLPPTQSCIRNIEIHAKSNSRYIMCLSWLISRNILLHFTHHHMCGGGTIPVFSSRISNDSPCICRSRAYPPFCFFHHCDITVSCSVMTYYGVLGIQYMLQ